MGEWRQQQESIVSSTFPSASRFHSAFIRTSLVSVNYHSNNPGEEAIRAHGEDPWERREGVEGGPGHQCDDARRQDQRQRHQPQTWQVRHVQGNFKQIVNPPTGIQVVVGNNQGECSTDVDVNIMDKPPEVCLSKLHSPYLYVNPLQIEPNL